MLGAIQDWCNQYFGWLDWDAVSGIGSVAALGWAITLANKQSTDDRRREAAVIRALIAITSEAEARAKQCAGFLYEIRTARLTGETRMIAGIAPEHQPDAMDRILADAERAINHAVDRLGLVDIVRIPSSRAIEIVHYLQLQFPDLASDLRGLKNGDPQAAGMVFLRLNSLKERSESLYSIFRELGGRDKADVSSETVSSRIRDFGLMAVSPILFVMRRVSRREAR